MKIRCNIMDWRIGFFLPTLSDIEPAGIMTKLEIKSLILVKRPMVTIGIPIELKYKFRRLAHNPLLSLNMKPHRKGYNAFDIQKTLQTVNRIASHLQ